MPLLRLRIACGRGAPRRVRRLCPWSRLRLAFYSRARPAYLRHRRRQLGPPIACAYIQHMRKRTMNHGLAINAVYGHTRGKAGGAPAAVGRESDLVAADKHPSRPSSAMPGKVVM